MLKKLTLSILILFSLIGVADDSFVEVEGSCLSEFPQDRASLSLSVEFTDQTSKAAVGKSQKQYEKIKEKINKLGLKNLEIETSHFHVNEDIEWSNNKRIFKGYRASIGLNTTTSEIDRIGEVIQIATTEGIKNIGGISTFVSREKLQEKKEEGLACSFKNAKSKATKLSSQSGLKLGKVISIREAAASNGGGNYPPMEARNFKSMMAVSADAAPQIDAASFKLEQTITVRFELK